MRYDSGNSPAQVHVPNRRRLILVDDHAIFRKGLRQLIESERDLAVCAETGSALKALGLLKRANPDLAIIDISLQDGNGLELTREFHLRLPRLRVLVLSMYDEALYGQRVLAAGGRGYVMKHEAPETLLNAVRMVLAGKVYASETVFSRYFDRIVGPRQPQAAPALDCLSDREFEVFLLIGSGYKNRHVAEKLFISVSTVETYQSHIERKLGLRNANELLQYAIHYSETRLAATGPCPTRRPPP